MLTVIVVEDDVEVEVEEDVDVEVVLLLLVLDVEVVFGHVRHRLLQSVLNSGIDKSLSQYCGS